MPFGSLSNVLEVKSAEGFRGSSVLQQSYPLTGYTVGAAPTPPAFTPLSLFSGGVQGVWYDPSDLTTMFTDSAGTTPVGTPGNGSAQPVGLLLDKSQSGVGTNGAYKYNLLTYTEQFDNGYWVKSQSSVSSNTTTAPDGTTTADSLIENTAGAAHYLNTTAISGLNSSVINTFSVALKANTRTAARIYLAETGYGGYAWGDFDLSSGTVYGSAGTAGTATSASASITSLGNGWYRCTITAKAGTGNTTCFVQINLLNQLPAPAGDSYTGNGTSGIYVWGAQATLSTAPTAYQKITSDWVSTMAGNHATQSTASARPTLSALYNGILYTEDFSNAYWTKQNISISSSTQTSPIGTSTACLISSGSGSGQHNIYRSVIATTANLQYTMSFSAKLVSSARPYVCAWMYMSGSSGGPYVTYNLNDQTVASSGVVAGAGTFVSSSITSQGNGWYRISITAYGNYGGIIPAIDLRTASSLVPGVGFSGSGLDDAYVWGIDLRAVNDGLNLPAYQRVGANTETYDSVGFPYYLGFNGVGQFLTSSSINFSGGDKMTSWSSIRKGAGGIILELSSVTDTNNGSFFVSASAASALGTNNIPYGTALRGTSLVYSDSPASFSPPRTDILTAQFDIAAARANEEKLRVDTVQQTLTNQGAANAGTGNFGTYPLYLGSRGGTQYWFNGRQYGIIVRGASSTATEVSNTETWLNNITKAY